MLYPIIIVLHILVAALLVTVVLMQAGRGGGLAGAFGGGAGGGGGGQTLFGGRGATTFLTKVTWILGGAFMVTSLVLALAIGRRTGVVEERSILQDNPIEAPATTMPIAPEAGDQTEPVIPPVSEPADDEAPSTDGN